MSFITGPQTIHSLQMTFNLGTFKTRALTAIVFAIVMVTGLLWNRWSFLILFTIIHFGCWYEFVKLIKKINPVSYKLISLSGLFYITLPVVLLLYMRLETSITSDDNFSKVLPCGIIFSIWINDTMAYIAGSFIGKTSLSKISPKKPGRAPLAGLCFVLLPLL